MENTASYSVDRVGIRVPPFWPTDPELWFAQLEGQFATSGITNDETKFGYVMGNLEPKYAAEVKDVIISPPAFGKFAKIKSELIKRLSCSQEQKTRQLLEREELGDRKPSQFLRYLRDLGGDAITESLLRTLWLGRLPTQLQAVLAIQTDCNLDTAANLADKVLEVSPQLNVAAVVNTPNTADTGLADTVTSLVAKIEKLELRISEMQFKPRARSRSTRSERSRSNSRRRDASDGRRLCWYHHRFGANARKCEKPCEYEQSSGNAKGSH